MTFSNKFLTNYKYKTFKKNLKFKKFVIGITKYITNRKRYLLKKKNSNYINFYYILSSWSKIYKDLKQKEKFFQLKNIFNYQFFKNSFSLNNTHFNFNKLSKKLLLNSSIFLKNFPFTINLHNNSFSFFYLYKINFSKINIRVYNTFTCFYNTLNISLILKFFLFLFLSVLKSYRKLLIFTVFIK